MKTGSGKKIFFYILTGICIGFLIKLFVFDALKISGSSMEPELKEGDVIFLNKLQYGLCIPFGAGLFFQWASPQQDDIVIYLYNNSYVVKRCVATGGMPLEYSLDNGYTLYAGGRAIPLTEEQYHLMFQSSAVPQGTILAVGDNYEKSHDSRNYGFVPEKNILGKVVCR